MPGPGDLYALCSEYLGACQEAVRDYGGGGEVPRSFVCAGPPAFDDAPQLTVHAGGPRIGDTLPLQPPLAPLQRVHTTGMVHLVTMTATIIRESPVPTTEGQYQVAPSPQSLQAVAEATLSDVWSIWNHVLNEIRLERLFPSKGGGRREFTFEPAVPLNTAGGVSGWQIPATVQIDGYKEQRP
jgi:hypothetical protein